VLRANVRPPLELWLALANNWQRRSLLDVDKAFDAVWIDGLLFKLTIQNYPSYIVHKIPSYLRGRTFEASFQTATSYRRGTRAGVAQGGLKSPVLFSLYANDMPLPPHHGDLAPYADETTIIATFYKPTLHVSYLESYLNDLQRWLSEWRIALNVSDSTAIIFARAGRRFIQPRPGTLFVEPNQLVRRNSSLGDPIYTNQLVASHRSSQKENCSKDGYAGSLPE
jgi:hypothetical protein